MNPSYQKWPVTHSSCGQQIPEPLGNKGLTSYQPLSETSPNLPAWRLSQASLPAWSYDPARQSTCHAVLWSLCACWLFPLTCELLAYVQTLLAHLRVPFLFFNVEESKVNKWRI